jgi:hypothetical protein
MRYLKLLIIPVFAGLALVACDPEASDPSTIQSFQSFDFNVPAKIEIAEADTVLNIPFTFDDNQIFDVNTTVSIGSNSTATAGEDFLLQTSSIEIPTLQKSGVIKLEIGSDLFLEQDEKVYLTLTSSHPSGLPKPKTIEINIKNVGGCPVYVKKDFEGDYEVVSDGWQDWTPGTVLTVTSETNDSLSFKYNCGVEAKPIKFKVNPATFGISGPKQAYCKYANNTGGLDGYSGDIIEASSNVNTCDKILNLNINHTVDGSTAAPAAFKIILKKK